MDSDPVSTRMENEEGSTEGANPRPRWGWRRWALTWILCGPVFATLFFKTGGRFWGLGLFRDIFVASLITGTLGCLVVLAWRRGGVIVMTALAALALLAVVAVAGAIYHKSREDAALHACNQISHITGANMRLGPTPSGRGTRCYLIFPDGRVEHVYLY